MATTNNIIERMAVRGTVDRANAVIRGVKICGRHSLNQREYLEDCLRGAASLYENAAVFADHTVHHPTSPRSVRDRIGTIRNVKYQRDGLFGDLHYNAAHPLAEQLVWAAEHDPTMMGLSHNVQARTSTRDGRTVVEAITKVISVDLVAQPATVAGLFESVQRGATVQELRAQIRRLRAKERQYEPPKDAKEFARRLREDAGPVVGGEPAFTPGEPESMLPSDQQFIAAIVATVKGEETKAAKLAKIGRLLDAWEQSLDASTDIRAAIDDIMADQQHEAHTPPASAAEFARRFRGKPTEAEQRSFLEAIRD